MQADEFRCMPNHPMKTRVSENWLKGSFVHESKKLTRQFQDRLPQNTLHVFLPDMLEHGFMYSQMDQQSLKWPNGGAGILVHFSRGQKNTAIRKH